MFVLRIRATPTARDTRSRPGRGRVLSMLAIGMLVTATGATTAQADVTVSPQPDSRFASPRTTLSFRGATPADVAKITVTGSRSGRHRGTVRAHSDGQGASWIPSKRFRENERITVRSSFAVVGGSGREMRIRTARFSPLPTAADTKRGNTKQIRSFRSRPDIHPPKANILQAPTGAYAAKTFLAPKLGKGDGGQMILDERGRMVYFSPTPNRRTSGDFRVQTYRGKPVLSYWQGASSRGEGHGHVYLLDQQYHQIARIGGGNGYSLDLHEAHITPQGTLLSIVYQPIRHDLRPVGALRTGSAVDSIIQEIDIPTGLVLFEWHSLDHVPITETVRTDITRTTDRLDYFHMNSVNEDGDDAVIVSARQTSAVYRVSKSTGRIDWRLGGKKSDFRMGPGTAFALQHDARPQADGTIRIFDNSSEELGKRSRSLVLRLDNKARTATRVADVRLPGTKLFAATQGNSQRLPDGGLMIGWGSQGRGSEISPDGRLRFDVGLPAGYDNYRYYRMPWEGRPTTPPKARAKSAPSGATNVWVSWNGATEVARWEVLDAKGAVIGRQLWTDFETWIRVPGQPGETRVRALDAAGRTLGTSRATRVERR